MLVVPEFQRRGLGQLVVRSIEEAVRLDAIRLMHLSARLAAVDFYAHCGYTRVGDEFVHMTIPHIRMEKTL